MILEKTNRLHARKMKVAVVGDIMLDRYVISHVHRVSPEAPVPVCRVIEDKIVPGGAANVARNLADFGCDVELVGILGKGDQAAKEVLELCDNLGIGTSFCCIDENRPTTVKTRVLGNGQQIVRIDRESSHPLDARISAQFASQIKELSGRVDLIIVSDYAKGALNDEIADALRFRGGKQPLVAVDPHPQNPLRWDGYSLIKPNLAELKQITGIAMNDYHGGDPRHSEDFMRAVAEIQKRWQPSHLLVTLSADGMFYADQAGCREWMPTRAAEVFDVSGAGDTSISFFSLALAAGWSGKDAMELATTASGIVIRKIGTASVSLEELQMALKP